MKIAVAGGTGLAGAHTVEEIRRRGHEPVVLSRRLGVDLLTGDGLEDRLGDVAAVIDTTNVLTASSRASVAFFGQVTETLLAAEQRSGVGHHVALSIVGIDRVDIGYYHGKLRQEELILTGAVPFTILRATQFHEFAGQILVRASVGPVSIVPRMRSQTVAVAEVAAALASAALDPPEGRTVELAGPRIEEMTALSRRLVARGGSRRLVVGVRIPGPGGRAMAAGGLLPAADGPRGRVTFDEWLADADVSPWL
jgi:uncharacterized protein YbjT (DUF2867 family)